MKDKLIQKIKEALASIEKDNIVLDYNDESKQEIIETLFVPFMETFNSETLDVLKEKIDLMIESENQEKADEIISDLADMLLEDVDENEIDELFDNIENFITNTYAIYEKLSNDETFKMIKEDVNNFIKEIDNIDDDNKDDNTNTNNDNDDDNGNKPEDKDADSDNKPESKDKDVDKNPEDNNTKPDDNNDNNPAPQKDKKESTDVTFKIVNPKEKVDEKPQSDVNKIELKNKLMDAYENADEKGKKELEKVIDEVFALVKSYDKMGDWKQPHHSINSNNEVLLNVNGLRAAALFLLKPNTSKNLTPEEKTKIAKHLLRHYNEIDENAPERLTKIAENKESVIIFNIKDDEYKEFSESFNVSEEDVYVYVGLMESLLGDLVNAGIITAEFESDDNNDESVMTVKLNKTQVEEMLKYFDVMTNDIVNILDEKYDDISYKTAKKQINDESIKEIMETNDSLKSEIEELKEKLTEYEATIAEKTEENEKQKVTNHKFMTIINFIKALDGVDETIIQFINNVIEAESEKEVDYLFKIGTTFMKSTKTTPKFKKVSNITGINTKKIFDLLDNPDDNKESGVERINKKVEALADYFD